MLDRPCPSMVAVRLTGQYTGSDVTETMSEREKYLLDLHARCMLSYAGLDINDCPIVRDK